VGLLSSYTFNTLKNQGYHFEHNYQMEVLCPQIPPQLEVLCAQIPAPQMEVLCPQIRPLSWRCSVPRSPSAEDGTKRRIAKRRCQSMTARITDDACQR